MVTKPLEQVDCGCGKQIASKGMTGHLRSKLHMDWVARQDPNNSVSVDPAPDDTLGLNQPVSSAEAVVDIDAEVRRILADPKLLAQIQSERPVVEVPLAEDEEAVLARARLYIDPIMLAKELRQIYAINDWPNVGHPATQLEWLKKHNIPIRTLPRHLDPDEVRLYMNNWYAELNRSGWGSTWEIK